ncbi:serine/threonine-protein kinase ULK4-like [Genypterus blacodes]|uniref:serine/threonine-protein kinase ULK4-like n=1 Tax=Genypterus blacodes TaxID=154954 RepID=UPI003F757821
MENFILYDELGRGSSSVVCKGRRTGCLNYVAITCTDKGRRPEVTNHVRWSRSLEHPNIVSFYELHETSSDLWLVMELCSGGSLESMIDLDGYLPEEVVRELGWGLVKGLNHIHASGLIFSGFTPAKILLDVSGVLKLASFFLSKPEGERLEDFFNRMATSEEAGGGGGKENFNDLKRRCRGPAAYSAPEVLQGSETSRSSDLWALGCILYYMYTGKPPFYSENYNKLIEMILHQDPPPLTQPVPSPCPPSEDFQSLLRGLLHRETEKRMDWPELLDHPFWAQVIKDERELEEEKEEDGDGGLASTRHTRIPDSFPSKVQTDKLTTSKPDNKHPTQRASKQCNSSQPRVSTTDRPSGKMSDSQQADRHTIHGASKNSQRRRRKKGGERREEEHKLEPAETKQSWPTVKHKSFTIDNLSEFRPKSGLDDENTEPFFLHRYNTFSSELPAHLNE